MTQFFPYKPNWAEGFEVRTSYRTDVFTSRSGIEQRRALRMTPRRTVTYSAVMIGDDAKRFQRLIASKQNDDFLIPDWTRFVRTLGIEAGAVSFTVGALAVEWLVPNAQVVVVEGNRTLLVTVDSVEGFTVTLTQPCPEAFGAGAVLRPVYSGLMTNLPNTVNTSAVRTVAVTFDVDPGSVPNSSDTYTPWLVSGKEVFGFRWNWAEQVSDDYQWDVEKVDFQRGVITKYRPQAFGIATQRATVVRHQHSEIGPLLRFLERAKGRRGEFWMPTGTDDMDMAADAVSGTTTISMEGDDLYADFSINPVYRGIAIFTRDGRRVFRRINSITLSGGNSVLNLNAPLTFALPRTLVAKISWLRPARFASDDQTIQYLTDTLVQAQVTTTTVSFQQDEVQYAEVDGAGYWVMDNWGEQSQSVVEALDYLVNVAMVYGDVAGMGLDQQDDLTNSEIWAAVG